MKPQEIRELSDKERGDKLIDLQEELFNLKFQIATGKIENPGRLKHMRRDIARIITIQSSMPENKKPKENKEN
ncbi:MAG: 50S ribosomal protein L29 [Nitrospinae bacterium]|nr:50S ribosomal protein L29 [Nitrospinota bacterium]